MKENEEAFPPLNGVSTIRLRGTVVEHFEHLTDPRIDRTKRHKLVDIIFIAISAAICGADNRKKN